MTISEVFSKVIAAGRPQFNQRVADARRRYPGFDTDAFMSFLQSAVNPVVHSVHLEAPERVAPTTLIAFDIGLELVGQNLAGPKALQNTLNELWESLIPRYARLVAKYPMEVLGSLSNAAIYIRKFPDTRPRQWLQELAKVAPVVEDLEQLQVVGQLLAWRAGLSHFRIGAIEAAESLPPELALSCVEAPSNSSWHQIRSMLLASPWFMPHQINVEKKPIGMQFGKFSGFGGDFIKPPEVRACAEGFYVRSGDRYGLLIADCFGAVMHSATEEEFENAANFIFPNEIKLDGSYIRIGKNQIDLRLPSKNIVATCNAHTVAVTSPYSHIIRLISLK